MTLRKSLLLLITLSAIAASVGCSSSSSAPPAPVAVVLSAVSTPLTVNSITPVTATVTGDTANAGVTWSCTPTPGCGTFSATTSASGVPVDYVAPTFIPPTTLSGTPPVPTATPIVITATSVTSPTTTASSQAITINNASLADGNYVFNLAGTDNGTANGSGSFSPYFVTGVFTVAGGAVTVGEQDFSDANTGPLFDTITGGTVSAGAANTVSNNNLQITLITGDALLGVGGTETINVALVPFSSGSTTALINEYDGSASGSGELDLQTASAATITPAGGYAFEVGGLDSVGGFFALGGILNVDDLGTPPTVGTISGAGSIFDANDAEFGTLYQNQSFTASTVSVPDPSGRVTFTLNSGTFATIVLAGYEVDGSRIKLIETTDSYLGINAGVAYSQASSLVGQFKAANVSGNTYVTGMTGLDINGFMQTVSQLTPSSTADGSVAGFLDFNDEFSSSPVSPDPVTAAAGATVVDVTGRVTITGLTDGTTTLNLQAYLDGNGHAMVISLDSTDVLSGVGYQMPSGALTGFTAAGTTLGYAVGLTGWDLSQAGEIDAVGTVVADGVGTFTGFADVNWLNSTGGTTGSGSTLVTGLPTYNDATVTGTFAVNAGAPGIFTSTVTGVDVTDCTLYMVTGAAGCTSDAFSYYPFDLVGDGFLIETDLNQLTAGRIVAQQ